MKNYDNLVCIISFNKEILNEMKKKKYATCESE